MCVIGSRVSALLDFFWGIGSAKDLWLKKLSFSLAPKMPATDPPRRGYNAAGGCSIAEEAFMRTIVLVAATLAALPFASIHAHADGPWCASYTKGSTNCGFYSYAQCLANVTGIGGYCSRNPAFLSSGRDARPRPRDY